MPSGAGRFSSSPRALTRKRSFPPASPRQWPASPRARLRTVLLLLIGVSLLLVLWREVSWNVPVHRKRAKPLQPPPEQFYRADGLLYDRAHDSGRHPILHLIEEGKREWTAKVARQSKTLQQAVKEYERRYSRKPPAGFDAWFTFAKERKVVLIDEYDQINRDLEPFLGMPVELLERRSRGLVDDENNYYHNGAYTFQIVGGEVAKVTGPWAKEPRAAAQEDLMDSFVKWLPDMNVTTWLHDTPVIHTAGENKERYAQLAREGKTLPVKDWEDALDRADFVGWESFCPPQSNLRKYMAGTAAGTEQRGRSFIEDHLIGLEICRHPDILNLHSLTSNYGIGPRAAQFWPLFSHSKTPMYSDILITPLEQYSAEVGKDPEWADKPYNKLLWRGGTTGSRYDRATLWRPTQRSRLNLLANDKDGERDVLLAESSGQQRIVELVPNAELSARLFDVAFTGQPVQCHEGDGTCDAVRRTYRFEGHMGPAQGNQYKYVMDVDGNGWSGRYHRLLASKSVVLKSTAFVEWYQDRIQPWVHYVPVKLDYSDLHHIMTFFLGHGGVGAHDEMGREIGEAGRRWAQDHWRLADMEVYMFRLYLEYARVMDRSRVFRGA